MQQETLYSNYIPCQIITKVIGPKLWTILDSLDQNFGPFWTLWDYWGISHPSHPAPLPLAMGLAWW